MTSITINSVFLIVISVFIIYSLLTIYGILRFSGFTRKEKALELFRTAVIPGYGAYIANKKMRYRITEERMRGAAYELYW